jgi:hypothetical protein
MITSGNYHYTLCGQNLCSEIPLPELRPSSCPGEISIRIGNVCENLPEAREQKVCWQAAPGRFLLRLPKIGRFLVEDGSSITIHPAEGTSQQDLRPFLLSSAMGALFHQRRLFPLHGSAVLTPKGALAIVGESSIGKSTLAAALVLRGFPILCDELCVFAQTEHGFQVWPETPHLRLWHDTLKPLRLSDQELPRLRPHLEKFLYTPEVPSATDSHPLWHVVVLTTDNLDEIRYEPIRGMKKFKTLRKNCFRFEYLPGLDLNRSLFLHYAQLAASTAVTRVTRSRGTRSIHPLADLVMRELGL